MFDPFNGKSIDKFREEQRERERQEKEAARKLPHEEMLDWIADLKSRVQSI